MDNAYTGASADGTVAPKKNALGGFEEKDARLQLLFTPTETFSILASGHFRDYDGTSTLFLRQGLVKGSNDPIAPRNTVRYDEAQDNPQAYKTRGASVKMTMDFGGPAELTSITAYETTKGLQPGRYRWRRGGRLSGERACPTASARARARSAISTSGRRNCASPAPATPISNGRWAAIISTAATSPISTSAPFS